MKVEAVQEGGKEVKPDPSPVVNSLGPMPVVPCAACTGANAVYRSQCSVQQAVLWLMVLHSHPSFRCDQGAAGYRKFSTSTCEGRGGVRMSALGLRQRRTCRGSTGSGGAVTENGFGLAVQLVHLTPGAATAELPRLARCAGERVSAFAGRRKYNDVHEGVKAKAC